MRLWQGTFAAAVAALALCAPPASAAQSGWEIGAARVDVTPPKGDDPAEFASCPGSLYNGPRPFSFNEPYIDQNGNGRFDYPDPYCDADGNGRYDGIYSSGGVDHLATGVHDQIDARAR